MAMRRAESIKQRLRAFNPEWGTTEQASLLAELENVWHNAGVYPWDAPAPALHEACPCCDACWDGAEKRTPSGDLNAAEDAYKRSILWPWIGPNYRKGGVCFISVNLNYAEEEPEWGWLLEEEYGLANQVIENFGAGDRTPVGGSSLFWERLLTTAFTVLRSFDGTSPQEDLEGRFANGVVALNRIARLQAVKCNPIEDRGWPTEAMIQNCPPRFAAPELKVLRPSVIVAFGRAAEGAALAVADNVQAHAPDVPSFSRSSITIGQDKVEFLRLAHPNARREATWTEGQRLLVESLTADGLAR